ncbi:MAG TPA: arginine decarboxylase, pyruvoyl-dependent [Firmicutes bacterium]|nr:arginine decarboxylase, pyruvoyl-dependent [Bacillota bacterium]
MIQKPEQFMIVAATAEGGHLLTAFDAALLKAGIGDVNLVRLSSILPPDCREAQSAIIFPRGAFVPTAYGAYCCEQTEELIAAAVGIGFAPDGSGVIMEHAGLCGAAEARQKVEQMLEEAFTNRGRELVKLRVKSVEHRVGKRPGAAFAGVALW